MSRRFSDEKKYTKHFHKSLPGAYKLFWDFLYLNCDRSGVWNVDMAIAQISVGQDMPINNQKALSLFNTPDEQRIHVFDKGRKWFIIPFVEFQYGQLSAKNNFHKPIIKTLEKFGFLNPDLTIKKFEKQEESPELSTFSLPPNNPPSSPLNGPIKEPLYKDKDKEEDKEKEKDKDNTLNFGKSENLLNLNGATHLVTQMQQVWVSTMPHYAPDRARDLPACRSIADFIFSTAGVTYGYGNTEHEIKCLNTFQAIADHVSNNKFWRDKPLKSVANNIQEFYNRLKNPPDNAKQQKSTPSREEKRAEFNDALNRRFAKSGQPSG